MAGNKLANVTVDKISLVTDEHTPAVPKATNQFALFKMKEKPWMLKLKKFIGLQTKPTWKKKIEKFVEVESQKIAKEDLLDIAAQPTEDVKGMKSYSKKKKSKEQFTDS